MKLAAGLMLILSFGTCFSKEDPKYAVKDIPDDMKQGMYAVIRESNLVYDIASRNATRMKYRLVITILNPNGKRYASHNVGYDKFIKIADIKANVYDANGFLIKKVKQSEITDHSAFSGYSLFEDNRLKHLDLAQAVYPYTVEIEYELNQKFLFSLPKFMLYEDDEVSIQKSRLQLIYPSNINPIYKLTNVKEPLKRTYPDGRLELQWEFENIKPSKFEIYSPDVKRVVPNILISPSEFEWDGYAGKMDTWENLGKWLMLLNQGRDVLPESTKLKVKELTRNATTTEEKTRILFSYLQSKTRYVSVQIGIGGLQPFPAATVDELGYGDCKALSNYMLALLKEAGVKGYYTAIYSDRDNDNEVTKDFARSYFNHVVVAVPNGADTLWLECTSQTVPFGYFGTSTCDRYALMVTEDGGKLVRTPEFSAEKNIQNRYCDVFVEPTGDAKASVRTIYSGLQYENDGLNFHLDDPQDEQKKWLQKHTGIPSFNITSFSMVNKKDRIPSAIVNVEYELKRLATVSGKRIFLTPNLMNKNTYIPEKVEARKTPVVRRMAYIDHDTIRYHLPEGIYPEFLPEPVKIKNTFGEYEATFKVDQGSLLYIRKVRMNKGEFPAESYNELIEFYRGISKADNTKIVFMSKT